MAKVSSNFGKFSPSCESAGRGASFPNQRDGGGAIFLH